MEPLEMTETTRIPAQSMRELVYGKPRRRRSRLPYRLVFLAALAGMIGCATARPPTADAPEAVGNLAASYHSITVAPVHATTDLTPMFGAVDTDEDAPTTAPADGGADAELPEVAPKTDGVKTGEVR